ncbi:CapA family protein [Streptomyces sp. RB6PN25]|uniref:CapA family protein n=2 Tax=Streptomyces humicola TaxID=2953240 RepID=A0ABT1Q6J9_9ACTN|nr:CapA family protein [Streptomyces humicola]
MTGRGVDQILPHPGDPRLEEGYLRDARDYVRAAEQVNGPIAHPVAFTWPWGCALRAMDDAGSDVRVINLETSVTQSDIFAPGKAVHYRMNPNNLPVLLAARPDVCMLANNHVLDFGRPGLTDTLDVLSVAGLGPVGAGRDAAEAAQPVTVDAGDGGRVVVLGWAATSSGVPSSWAAGPDRPGVNLLPDLSDATADMIAEQLARLRRRGDVVIVSVHWGSNWGYGVAREQIRFAHRLVDAGADIVHGHSSHHPRPVEIHKGKLILYGCGDFIDDYEGIGGYEEYRDDLRLLYVASVEPETGRLASLRMTPLQARRMRLHHASHPDTEWTRDVLDRISRRFATRVDLEADGTLVAAAA